MCACKYKLALILLRWSNWTLSASSQCCMLRANIDRNNPTHPPVLISSMCLEAVTWLLLLLSSTSSLNPTQRSTSRHTARDSLPAALPFFWFQALNFISWPPRNFLSDTWKMSCMHLDVCNHPPKNHKTDNVILNWPNINLLYKTVAKQYE